MADITYEAKRGLSLLGDEVGAWMADTTEETLVGSELVTNGDFGTDSVWTKGAGWTIPANYALHTAGDTATIYQAITLVEGLSYLITYTISSMTVGAIIPSLGGQAGTQVSANGTYPDTIIAGADGTVAFTPSSSFDGPIHRRKRPRRSRFNH